MKPGDLVRFRQDTNPHFDIELYDNKLGLIIETLMDKYGDQWARVMVDEQVRLFRTRFFEVIDDGIPCNPPAGVV